MNQIKTSYNVTDVLIALMHFCDKNKNEYNWDFEDHLESASNENRKNETSFSVIGCCNGSNKFNHSFGQSHQVVSILLFFMSVMMIFEDYQTTERRSNERKINYKQVERLETF